MNIYTIGHSNYTWEVFLSLLRQQNIQLLVDIRSRPYSRWAAFANRTRLPVLLAPEGIDYAFMGDALGGKPAERALYGADDLPDYALIAGSESYKQGLKRLIALARESTTAIMCSEEDPSKCHRHLLMGPGIAEAGIGMSHIRKDGRVLTSEKVGPNRSHKAVVQGEFPKIANREAP